MNEWAVVPSKFLNEESAPPDKEELRDIVSALKKKVTGKDSIKVKIMNMEGNLVVIKALHLETRRSGKQE